MIIHLAFWCFFSSKLFLIWFSFQLFFVKYHKSFFSVSINNNICLRHCIFNYFNYKNFFRPIRSVTFCKNIFIFWYSNNIIYFNLGFLLSISSLESRYVFYFTSTCFILNCAMICILFLLNIFSIYQYEYFLIWKLYTYKFYFPRF